MMVGPTITLNEDVVSQIELYERSESSSDSCKDKSSGACQKPTSTSTLGIVLAVVIPVVVVICVLGYFLFRNYRKEKRESNEHDPDFDENGEATALPDFPFSKGYEFEDPFKNQKTDRYTYFKNDVSNSNASFVPTVQGKPYLEEFILPYQHQTGSKVSLDDYARQIGGFNNYGQTSRTSLNVGGSSRSSMSNFPAVVKGASETSPQKSNLRSEMVTSQKSPSKTVGNKDYVNIPNYSFSQHEFQDTEDHSDLESVSDSNSNSSRENNSNDDEKVTAKDNIDDSNGIIHSTFQSADEQQKVLYTQGLDKSTTNELFDTTHEDFERIEPNVSISEYAFSNRNSRNEHIADEDVDTIPGNEDESDVKSPFENELANAQSLNNEKVEDNADFNFSGSKEYPQGNSTFEESAGYAYDNGVNKDVNNYGKLLSVDHPVKSPRMSAFNLLQNDSDEEEQEKEITAEQEEEIQRMKSIYKVYFDRANSQKSQNPNLDQNKGFKYDESNPLPSFNNEEEIRINNQLKVDTSDKRLTTTSSIYTDLPESNEQHMQYIVPNQTYQDYNFQAHHQQQNIQQPAQYFSQEQLPPLQQLPNASEIRKSTIQTYTDFHPRMKNSTTMPNLKHPYNPMEDEGVWSSPVNSPATQSQTSFMSVNSTHQSSAAHGPPSATQMSRTSVVLLNPVTEITKSRKFKPAGSIGGNNNSVPNSPSLGQHQFQQSQLGSESELIPGNRKSDIRRMMNSNF